MADYRKDYIESKIKAGPYDFAMESGKMMIRCSDGFAFEVVPVMARALHHLDPKTNELTTITKSSISVKQLRERKAEQLTVPGVKTHEA